MKDIKCFNLLIFLWLAMVFSSCEEDIATSETLLEESFIRFSFQTNSNNEPIEYPNSGINQPELNSYTLNKRDTIKIPVVLSSAKLNDVTEASYSFNSNNVDASEFSIFSQEQQLQFQGNQLSDTIYVVPNRRLDNLNEASIDFELNAVSNSDIHLGYPNSLAPLNTFRLELSDFEPIRYEFLTSNIEIQGLEEELYTIEIGFDQIVNPEDINGINWLTTDFIQNSCSDELAFDFDFNLEMNSVEAPTKTLKYSLEILNNFEDLSANLNVRLQEVEDLNFIRQGQNLIQFFKSGVLPDRSGDPAAAFYNVSDRFHRTYGKAWILDDNTNECQWRDFQSFTRPVEVESGSEFDNGSGYHRYKIGFRNINRNINGDIIGTNPFNLRRFYDGASVLSAAFTQMESLEFFPENDTEGTVRLSIQNLEFIVDDQIINIPVCGNGTYRYDISNDRWEIFVTLITDESEINGSTNAEKFLYIYTELVNEDPEPLTNLECATPINL